MKLMAVVLVLGIVQLVWLYKAFKAGGFMAVVNLVGFALLTGVISVYSQYLSASQI